MGEPTLFCKDLWRKGYRKIQVVPSVNVAYTVQEARRAKAVRGRVADSVDQVVEAHHDALIQRQKTPPLAIKCFAVVKSTVLWSVPSWVSPL
jgi:alpha-1,3-mannosyltransferase